MKHALPWNVTGIPPEAREMARTAAMREGLSVGDWLTRRIVAETARSGPSEARSEPPPPSPSLYERDAETARDREFLARQLARSEEQSELAFRRIDEALRNVGRRLESTERTQSEAQQAMSVAASEINAATRDQAQAFALLTERIDRVERNADTSALRDAVRGLHQGLSRLAEQIARTATESTGQISTLAGNIETLAGKIASAREDSARLELFVGDRLNVLNDRLKQAEERIAASAKLEESIAKLEAAANVKLEETVAEIETRIAANTKLEGAIDDLKTRIVAGEAFETRISALESRAAASSNIEQTVSELRSRLDAGAILQETSAGRLEAELMSLEQRVQDTLGRHLAPIERNLERIAARFDDIEQRNIQTIRDLGGRLDSTETKNRDGWDDLRSALEETAKRVHAIESSRTPAQAAAPPPIVVAERLKDSVETPEAQPPLVSVPGHADPSDGSEAAEDQARSQTAPDVPTPKAAPSRTEDYLAQARRAARAAAETGTGRGAGSYLAALGLETESSREQRKAFHLSQTAKVGILVVLALLAGLLTTRMFGSRAPTLPPRATPAQTSPTPVTPAAIRQLTERAAAGDMAAALVLGLKYADGDGVTANAAEAFGWLRKAALSGSALGQYRLGTLYEKGLGVAADPKQAFFWYAQAAKIGNRKAMHNLAVAYANGVGTDKNYGEAVRWFKNAAELGLTDSQFNLAVLYERGLGIEASLPQAYKWYAIAAMAGDTESKTRIEALATQLKPADRDTADKAAKSFHPAPMNSGANEVPDPASR
jgi:localization factor PodJL